MSLIKIEEQDYEGNVYHKTTSADIVIAKDTGGLAGTVGENSNVQTLLDKLTDRVVNKLIEKGLIVDNFATQIKGFIPDATLITNLKKQLDEQNKNINYELIRDGNPDNYTATTRKRMFNATGNVPFGMEGDNDFFLDVASSNSDEDLVWQIARNIRAKETKFRNRIGGKWTDWDKYVTNSDFKRTIEIRLPYIAFGGKLYASYAFPVRLDSIPKVTLDDYYIDGIGHVDSFRNYLVNQEEVVFEFTKSDMNFELGKCYIGRTRFTIS